MSAQRSDETISQIDSWIVPVELRRPHVMSFGAIPHASLILVRVTSSSGAIGWGETTILGGPYWNEESAESVQAVITRYLGPRLIGMDLQDTRQVSEALRSIRRNHFARSAIDIALHDLRARLAGIPVSVLLGGSPELTLPVSWSLAGKDLHVELDELQEKLEAGHSIIKVKMGSLPVKDDIRRVETIREHLDSGVSLRVDANQGWSRSEAGYAVSALDALQLDFIEQPLKASDLEGMRQLQSNIAVPLAADESLEGLDQANRIIAMDAARVFILKLAKHAGYQASLSVADVGHNNGIGTYLGCMIESSIGTAASLAFAAAAPRLTHGCELFGPALLMDDLVEEPIELTHGEISVPNKPGLGVDVDVDKVDRLATTRMSAIR